MKADYYYVGNFHVCMSDQELINEADKFMLRQDDNHIIIDYDEIPDLIKLLRSIREDRKSEIV